MVDVGLGRACAARRAFGVAVELVQLDVARDGRRRVVRFSGLVGIFRIGLLDRFLAALLFGDVGDAHGAVCRNDVGVEQDLAADQVGMVDHVQAGLNVRFVGEFHADALVGAVLVGFRGQQDVAARGGVGPDGTHGGLCVGFGPGDVAPDPDGRFPGGSREVAHAERIVPGSGRQRRCGRIGGVFGGVVAARSGEQREDQQKE